MDLRKSDARNEVLTFLGEKIDLSTSNLRKSTFLKVSLECMAIVEVCLIRGDIIKKR